MQCYLTFLYLNISLFLQYRFRFIFRFLFLYIINNIPSRVSVHACVNKLRELSPYVTVVTAPASPTLLEDVEYLKQFQVLFFISHRTYNNACYACGIIHIIISVL